MKLLFLCLDLDNSSGRRFSSRPGTLEIRDSHHPDAPSPYPSRLPYSRLEGSFRRPSPVLVPLWELMGTAGKGPGHYPGESPSFVRSLGIGDYRPYYTTPACWLHISHATAFFYYARAVLSVQGPVFPSSYLASRCREDFAGNLPSRPVKSDEDDRAQFPSWPHLLAPQGSTIADHPCPVLSYACCLLETQLHRRMNNSSPVWACTSASTDSSTVEKSLLFPEHK